MAAKRATHAPDETWIDLTEADYAAAGLRHRIPLPPPPDVSYNIPELLLEIVSRNWSSIYRQLSPPCRMDATAARFWMAALINPRAIRPEIEDSVRNGVDMNQAALRASDPHTHVSDVLAVPLYTLVGFAGAVAWLADIRRPAARFAIIDGLCKYVVPYLAVGETEGALPIVRAYLRSDPLFPDRTPAEDLLLLGAELGMVEDVRPILDQPPNEVTAFQSLRFRIAMTLRDADLVVSELERRAQLVDTPAAARMCLAVAGARCVEPIARKLCAHWSNSSVETVAKVLARAHAPEAAVGMLRLLQCGKAVQVARAWFVDNPYHTAVGLMPLVEGGGKDADIARAVLEDLLTYDNEDILRPVLGDLVSARADDVQHGAPVLVDTAMTAELDSVAPETARTPNITDPLLSDLPPIDVNTPDGVRSLDRRCLLPLFEAMRKSTLDAPHPMVAAVRRICEPRSLDAFSIALLETWVKDGVPSKARWRMVGAALLGGDGLALKLGGYIQQWPGEGGHSRSVFGLQCLLAIGTDAAYAQLCLIASKSTYAGLKKKAQETTEALAAARGMTVDELDDRVVPRCDLDARGTRLFDYGPRQFRFVLSGEMKPMLRDPAGGKATTELPAARKDDDPSLVARAKSDWAIAKTQIAQTAKVQASRFERAMVSCRRWPEAAFRAVVMEHPVLSLLGRRVVWGAYEPSDTVPAGSLKSTFRLTEDGTLADGDDSTYVFPSGLLAGIVHPVHLSDGERSAWGEILSDYEIVAPFRQLGREFYHLTPEERASTELGRAQGAVVTSMVSLRVFKNKAWSIDSGQGVGTRLVKPFPMLAATAVLDLGDWNWTGSYAHDEASAPIVRCRVLRGVHADPAQASSQPGIPWGDVDPVVPSEVLRDVTAVTKKP